jgi:hypothetical protein
MKHPVVFQLAVTPLQFIEFELGEDEWVRASGLECHV